MEQGITRRSSLGKDTTRMLLMELGSMGSGSASKGQPARRKKKRSSWRLPISIAISAFMVFLFFVALGRQRGGRAGVAGAAAAPKKPNQGNPTMYTYEIMAEFPHDQAAFTQGFQYEERCAPGGGPCREIFWESTGLNGRSSVREVDMKTGDVLRTKALPKEDFGEGLTRHGDRLYQVTWQTNKGWSYAVDDFEDVQEFNTPLQDGWGATSNGTHLIVSDSSDVLSFIDPETMEVVRTLPVTDGDRPVKWLNELEWVDSLIYANVYQTECVAHIDPNTGAVIGWMVLKGLRQRMIDSIPVEKRGANWGPDVLNGIAWDQARARLFLTGKLWPKVYQIEGRPMYLDSKATDIHAILEGIRAECIVNPAPLG